MENIKDIEFLLSQIASVNKRYDEIAKATGENFNVFNTLGLTSDEMSHSKFIAMLLNPKGQHGMDDLFLKLFVEVLSIDKLNNIDYSDVTVNTEKHFNMGILDILITTKSREIIIENKIYAGDQDKQLLRYRKYYENAVLLYLTLYGSEPSEISANGLKVGEDYHCISYRSHILDWLEECRKESVSKPFLRETINQYILLAKQLTRQARSTQMREEIIKILSNPTSIQAAFTISNLRQDLKGHLLKHNLFAPLKDYAQKEELEFKHGPKINEKWFAFWFKKPHWTNITIRFEFTGPAGSFRDFRYGIWGKPEGLAKCLGSTEGKHTTLLRKIDGYNNWNDNVFIKLASAENEVVDKIKEKVEELLSLIVEKAGDIKL